MLGPGRGLPCEADTEGSLVRDELSDLRGDINSALGRMVSSYFPGEVSGIRWSRNWWPSGSELLQVKDTATVHQAGPGV